MEEKEMWQLVLTPNEEGKRSVQATVHTTAQTITATLAIQGRGFLPVLVRMLEKKGYVLSQCAGIRVTQGVGSFTVLRQIISVANSLAVLRGIRLGKTYEKKWNPAGVLLVPTYSGEPNIGVSKKRT